jgi:hypothetical protein
MSIYKVKLIYKQEYEFTDIEADSEQEAIGKAQELVGEATPQDAYLHDSEAREQ